MLAVAEFEVNLVEDVRHENSRTDHASAIRDAHLDIDSTEKDEEVCPELWCIVPFVVGEFCA